MIRAQYQKHLLQFKRPSGTSRGILTEKETYFLILRDNAKVGIGECGILKGLSIDDRDDYEEKLNWVVQNIALGEEALYQALKEFPSIQIGVETAFKSLQNENPFEVFPSAFSRGEAAVPINGLVWMGDENFMKEQISERLAQGFSTIKMKVGAIDFDKELKLLRAIRKSFSPEEITLRVDANGAFEYHDALEKLKRLSELELHSIEQPIMPKQWQEMAALCEVTPVPIALDEELIGVFSTEDKVRMLQTIKPQFIILKPSLIGGFKGSDEWIQLAEENDVAWWITSALESNIGLNAIAQYTFIKNNLMPQGLGTGSLYTNNFPSPLEVIQGKLHYNSKMPWNVNYLN